MTQKSSENTAGERKRGSGRPFQPGNKFGRGRPKGTQNKSKPGQTLIDEYGEHLVRKCIALAMQGDRSALRMCMERISPARRGALLKMKLPKIQTTEDIGKAAEDLTQAIQRGEITPSEGSLMMNIFESRARVIERVQLESRLQKLEEILAPAGLRRVA